MQTRPWAAEGRIGARDHRYWTLLVLVAGDGQLGKTDELKLTQMPIGVDDVHGEYLVQEGNGHTALQVILTRNSPPLEQMATAPPLALS